MSKKAITSFVIGLLFSFASFAADNSIYIQQAGDNATVTMTQDGAGNIVQGIQGVGSGPTTPALINGNNNTVTVDQVGTGDVLSFGIQTTIANGVSGGNDFSYTVIGNNASAVIDSNADGLHTSASNSLTVSQTGNYAKLKANILGTANSIDITTIGGSNNVVYDTVNGNNNNQTVSISGGGYNTVEINQGVGGSAVNSSLLNLNGAGVVSSDNSGTINLSIVGASNTVNIDQEGGGALGHTAVISLTGSSNLANITQLGTSATSTINLLSSGSNNVFNITSNTH